MNTDVKCSIIEASSNELLYQIEVHNGLIPAYIVKKHDGPIPYIHSGSQPSVNIFFQPDNLGALPALWLQAKLAISLTLTSIQDKFAKLFMTIAAELWLRGRVDTLKTVFQATARNFTIRTRVSLLKNALSLLIWLRASLLATMATASLHFSSWSRGSSDPETTRHRESLSCRDKVQPGTHMPCKKIQFLSESRPALSSHLSSCSARAPSAL